MSHDPITLNIVWSRLVSICDEAETGLMRTSFVARTRELGDFCCVLLTTEGESLAQGSLSQISFATTAPQTAQNMLKKFPADTLEPGDILITNIPWLQSGHTYDVFVMEPIFNRGTLIALAGCVTHWSDIGGRGEKADNRSVYEEGLQLPMLKIAKRGQFNEEVVEIIRENVRFPDDVIGEFKSQLLGINLIRNKLIELIEKQGIDDFGVLAEGILSRSEAVMRKAIADIPDGDYDSVDFIEGIDRELTLKMKLEVRGSDLHVDFTGTSPQSQWAINSMPLFTYSYTFIGLKMALCPHLPNNSGPTRAVRVTQPEGTIVNPRYKSVGAALRHIVAHYCCLGALSALGKAFPELARAETGPGSGAQIMGVTVAGKPFYAFTGGTTGLGASVAGDGLSCVHFPMSIRALPVEMAEYSWPMLLFEAKGIRADSGGAGRHRGGFGNEIRLRIMEDIANAQGQNAIRRIDHPAQGISGGLAGAGGKFLHNGEAIPFLRSFPIKPGDQLVVLSGGGGGYGDPLEREPGLVLEDVLDELVSPELAEAGYGVVIDMARRKVDLEATVALRKARQLQQTPVFSNQAR